MLTIYLFYQIEYCNFGINKLCAVAENKLVLGSVGEEKRAIPTIYRRHISSATDSFYCCRWCVDQTNLLRRAVKEHQWNYGSDEH